MEPQKNLCAFFCLVVVYLHTEPLAAATQRFRLDTGFRADSDPSARRFQPLLYDPTGIFSFGFLGINSSRFDLAVVHGPSNQALWRASLTQPDQGAGSVYLSFNGSLVFSDNETGVPLWSTSSASGDRVVLNSSNLQILKLAELNPVLWQSFDFPSDTLVEGQNFTSATALVSLNQRYAMKLGSDYLALFMEFGAGVEEPMYWKRRALQSKNQIINGQGPLYARVDPAGFIGLYQKEKAEVDVVPFDSFGRGIPGFRRITIEDDGNLRGYYWNGTIWASDYVAIRELCKLPNPCGAYGLCRVVDSTCGCIDNRSSNGCLTPDSGNLCRIGDDFSVLRRNGVYLGNKDVLGFVKLQSPEECEVLCERNCSCWGSVYNNGSGYCYSMNYPVQTVEAVGDTRMMGYFKVRKTESDAGSGDRGRTAEVFLIIGVVAVIAAGGAGVYRLRSIRMRKEAHGSIVEGLSPGPYKDLSPNSRSIELVDSFRK